MLTAAGTISFAVLALPAGVWVDRVARRPVLVGADLVRGLALATVPVAGALGRLTLAHLAVVALVTGMARVLFDVAYPSYLPALVGRDDLVRANAYLESSRSATQLAGPAGGPAPGAGRGARVRARPARPAGHHRLHGPDQSPVGAAYTVQLLFLVHQVGLDPAAIGLLFSAGAAGGLLAALAATRVARGADTARLIWLPVTVTAPFALCTPLTAPGWRVALLPLGVAVTSFGQALYNVAQISYRQALCPPELLGRMNASIRFLVFGALPLGGLLGGLAGERLGVHPTLWLSGVGLALTPVPLLVSPLRPASELGRGRRQ